MKKTNNIFKLAGAVTVVVAALACLGFVVDSRKYNPAQFTFDQFGNLFLNGFAVGPTNAPVDGYVVTATGDKSAWQPGGGGGGGGHSVAASTTIAVVTNGNLYTLWVQGVLTNNTAGTAAGATNDSLGVSIFTQFANGTNQSLLIGASATNDDLLFGLGSTNQSLKIGGNATNNDTLVSLALSNTIATASANATNQSLLIGANATNDDFLFGLNSTNQSLKIGLNGTNNTTQATNDLWSAVSASTNTIAGYARTLAAASTNYTITATNDSAAYARSIGAASTNYTVTATNDSAGYARSLALLSTNYTVTATNDSAAYARTLASASTNYTVTATNDSASYARSLASASTNYTVTATNDSAAYARAQASLSTNYTVTATNSSAAYDRSLAALSTNYTITATNDSAAYARAIGGLATNNDTLVTGNISNFLAKLVLTNDSRNLVLSGATNFLGTDAAATHFWGDGTHLSGISGSGIALNNGVGTNTLIYADFTVTNTVYGDFFFIDPTNHAYGFIQTNGNYEVWTNGNEFAFGTNTTWLANLDVTGWENLQGTETNSTITTGLVYADGNGGRSSVVIGSGLTLSSGTLTSSGGAVTGPYVTNLYGFATNFFAYGTNQFGTNATGAGITVMGTDGSITHWSPNDTYSTVNTWGTNGSAMLMQWVGSNALVRIGGEVNSINSNTNSTNAFYFVGATTNFFQGLVQNTNALGSGDLVVAADNGNDSQWYVDMGINNSKYRDNFVGYSNDAYFYFQGPPTNAGPGGDMWIGTASSNKTIRFFSVGTAIGTITNLTITPTAVTIPVGTILLDKTAATAAGFTNTTFSTVGWVTNDANGKTYTSADVPNAALHNSTVGISGTANQIASSSATPALGGSTTLSLTSPLLAPGVVSATGLTNTAFAAVGVVTNDANGKLYTTTTLPVSLLGSSSVANYGGSTGPQAVPVNTTAWYPPNNSATNISTADASGVTRCVLPNAGTLQNLYVVASANPGAVANTVTVMTNGVSTGITVTLNNVLVNNDTTHIIPVAVAGVEVGIKVVSVASATAVKWSWGFQYK